jgi:hypothetical protein
MEHVGTEIGVDELGTLLATKFGINLLRTVKQNLATSSAKKLTTSRGPRTGFQSFADRTRPAKPAKPGVSEGRVISSQFVNLFVQLPTPGAKPIPVGKHIPSKAIDALIDKIVNKYNNVDPNMFVWEPSVNKR